MDFTVTIKYDPGTPFTYVVWGAKDSYEARKFVLDCIIGYDPGVLIVVKPWRGTKR